MNNFIILLFVFVNSLGADNGLNLCSDWTQYKDNKCFKVLVKKGTEEEALKNCSELDKSSTLITIHNKEEQEFLNILLSKYTNISNNVWIGMKYTEKTFKWMDGTDSGFTNWAEDAVINGGQPCVEMSLLNSSLGKWRDESCIRKALIVCQKKPVLRLSSLKDIIENMNKQILELKSENVEQHKGYQAENQELRNHIDKQSLKYQELLTVVEKQNHSLNMQINSLIPFGFLYTQLPDQSPLQKLWPKMKWVEVTKDFAGLFFRAEGAGSEMFGKDQEDNHSRISQIFVRTFNMTPWTGAHTEYENTISLEKGKWSVVHNWAFDQLQFFTTGG